MRPRILLISPVRNEQPHIELVVRAVAGQTRPPDRWVVVDDGSDDGTLEVLRALEGDVPFMTVTSTPPGYTKASADRLAAAAAPRAFNFGLRTATLSDFTHVGKLDGDTELPLDYFERLLAKFDAQPTLGIAGGIRAEWFRDRWRELEVPRHHVPGALKLYRRQCFEAIGGMHERLAWDGMDEIYARMRGFETRSFPDLVTRHHRPWGSADGTLRGRARYGQAAYILHYTPLFTALRALKVARAKPRLLSGAAFTYGYVRAALGHDPQVPDPQFRAFVHRELGERLREPLRRPLHPLLRD
jgi:poly-beta-1,6-N-acetyl-D-glucosamine synthase